MEKTKRLLPDAVYAGTKGDFTQIPNEIIRSPKLSLKAKGVLLILLSNKEGEHFYIKNINAMVKETPITVRVALKELEEKGYIEPIEKVNPIIIYKLKKA